MDKLSLAKNILAYEKNRSWRLMLKSCERFISLYGDCNWLQSKIKIARKNLD